MSREHAIASLEARLDMVEAGHELALYVMMDAAHAGRLEQSERQMDAGQRVRLARVLLALRARLS